ncbi:mismatch repair protein MSH3 KNAG_0I02660 [Huiozyma naganishii CBS 8797]|uniref:DNA mismatch repair protein MSH3 n=1 Tax=Huiozyma naganishii (strain ATCC MYA-139 / BCRC 22969 / CBS 8797 / KCTC 17520 / NBRC 10181 / NCYC 3082 / Yp74L-3) TaxID=1071383 RepID=J7SAC9_HUIN7|nr:hypothetical protein KNAG_0I02660 [Kazachstania naganishii CBS 8797]CCK72051.1 hypothetical protein KNAG_0I02660 [Kazachstania naganishii CBS 8797]
MAAQPTISRFFKAVKKEPKDTNQDPPDECSDIGKTAETSISLSDEEDKYLGSIGDSRDGSSERSIDTKVQEEPAKRIVQQTPNPPADGTGASNVGSSLGKFALNGMDLPETDTNKNANSNSFAKRLNSILNDDTTVEDKDVIDKRPSKMLKVDDSKETKLTPLDEQVRSLKLQNMDKILLVRVGYKYKCFAEDAIIVSSILHIKLVQGKLTLDNSNPHDSQYKNFAYCSFPDVRLNINLERLIHENLKVGIVEQSETSSLKKQSENKSKSVFEREVTNVVSKATYGINVDKARSSKESPILGDTKSIWILKVVPTSEQLSKYSLVSVNLNSGEVIFDEFSDTASSSEQLITRVKYLDPIEVILQCSEKHVNRCLKNAECQITEIKEEDNRHLDAFNELKVDVPVPETLKELVAHLYHYLHQYNNENILLITDNYRPFTSKMFMLLDGNAMDALDIFSNEGKKGSLFWVLNHTRTPFGSRQLRNWVKRPLLNTTDIEDRLDAIECISEVINDIFFESLNHLLKSIPDLSHTLNRITYGRTSRREVYYFLKQICSLIDHFKLHQSYIENQILLPDGKIPKRSKLLPKWFQEMYEYLKDSNIPRILTMVNVAAVMEKDPEKQQIGFLNLNNYDNPAKIIDIQRNIESIQDEMNVELNNIRKFLKRPYLNYRDEVDYLIEVRNSQVKGLPDDWVKVNSTKSVSRFLTPKNTKLLQNLQYQKDLLLQETRSEFLVFLQKIKAEYTSLNKLIQKIANYDCILALAATSCAINYVRPKFETNKGQFVSIVKGRNAVIESLDRNYVPNDSNMYTNEGKITIITGPNMGGKSSYIRQVALLIVMAQIGSFVPAHSMELSLFDNIFTRIGANDNLLQGQSTFMVEMSEILHIIKRATPKSLLLLDEVGRGTGTIDGRAICYAILKYYLELVDCPLILFTTHFPDIGKQLRDTYQKAIKNFYMDYVEEQKPGESWQSVIFLYQLKEGLSEDSYGLNVAKLAGIDSEIINSAYQVSRKMKNEESESEKLLKLVLGLRSIFQSSENKAESNGEQFRRLLEICDN